MLTEPILETLVRAIAQADLKVGPYVRVMITGCLLFAVPTPSLAQFAMPDMKEMSGIPRPVTDLPNGAVSVRLIRGQLSNNITDHPVELHGGERVQTVKTDETGRAQFEGLKPGTAVRAVATVDGERLTSREFEVPQSGGIRVMLVATAKDAEGKPAAPPPPLPTQTGTVTLGSDTRFVIELTDDGPQVFYLFEILNNTTAPVNPAKPFTLELPSGATNAGLMQGSSPQALLKGSQLTVNGPFASGKTLVQVGFLMPPSGTMRLSQTLPAPLDQLSVVVRKLPNVALTSPQLTSRQDVAAEGQTYIMASGPAVAAGSPVTFEVTGMPHHGATPRTITVILALAIVAAGVWASVSPKERSAAAARRQHLQARREKLFGDLVRLEQQKRAGQVDHDQYLKRRHGLVAQLERVYGELDQRGGVRGNEGLAA